MIPSHGCFQQGWRKNGERLGGCGFFAWYLALCHGTFFKGKDGLSRAGVENPDHALLGSLDNQLDLLPAFGNFHGNRSCVRIQVENIVVQILKAPLDPARPASSATVEPEPALSPGRQMPT